MNVPLLSETVGYERAKKHFRNNKEKLKLLNANDLFFCDWKIYNLLRKPLGKLFYEKKRYHLVYIDILSQSIVKKYLKNSRKSSVLMKNILMISQIPHTLCLEMAQSSNSMFIQHP
jgi:hypothetical protein